MNQQRISMITATRPAPANGDLQPAQPRPKLAMSVVAWTRRTAVWMGLLLASIAAPGHAQATAAPNDTPTASRQAHDRHREAITACRQATDPAACNRAADADLATDLREANRLRAPGAAAGEPPREQQRQLLRELEQAAPRPLPRPRAD